MKTEEKGDSLSGREGYVRDSGGVGKGRCCGMDGWMDKWAISSLLYRGHFGLW